MHLQEAANNGGNILQNLRSPHVPSQLFPRQMQRYILFGGIFPKKNALHFAWKTFENGGNFGEKIESLTRGWTVEARLSPGWMMKNYDEKC